MSCRWARTSPASDVHGQASETLAVYRELARDRRKDEFRWLAQSQGVPTEHVERMWRAAVAETSADGSGTPNDRCID